MYNSKQSSGQSVPLWTEPSSKDALDTLPTSLAEVVVVSHQAAIDRIEAICEQEGIACEFERVEGYLFGADEHSRTELTRELAACRRAGLDAELLAQSPLPFKHGPAICFQRQAQFHPTKYLEGLAAAIHRLGGLIITGAKVTAIHEQDPVRVELENGHSIAAGSLVVATNSPVNDVFAMHTKQASYRSYVIGVRVRRDQIQKALYWDTREPYHYVRLTQDGEILIVGGEDHKVGQSNTPEASWAHLESWLRERIVDAGEVVFRWSGQIQEPADGLAFIGRNPGASDHVFIVTGDSGNGITHGAIAGMLVKDLVLKQENPWQHLYDPGRKIVRPEALRSFFKENVNVAIQYTDWLSGTDKKATSIEPGHGAVQRRGVRRVAVYVDEAGRQHECSAVCPHLGGVVRWNRAERSWDCPCHGSRFDPHGRVMTGPAKHDLAPVEDVTPQASLQP